MTAKEALLRSGVNLRSLREAKGYSLATFSVLTGLDEETLVACERGEFDIPVRAVYEMAAALNVDFRQILVDPTVDQSI